MSKGKRRLGDMLRIAMRRCRNCARVGGRWYFDGTIPWQMYRGVLVHGVCSQRCNDRMVDRFAFGHHPHGL